MLNFNDAPADKEATLQYQNHNQVAAPPPQNTQSRARLPVMRNGMWLDLCPNPSDVSLFTTGAYAWRGGERGFRAVEEVMRVTRVQLVDHWNVNEPLMCFWLSSPLCSQQDLSYLVLWTVGFQWERLEGSNGDSGVHFLIVQIRCDVRFTKTRLAVFPLYFLISKPGNR